MDETKPKIQSFRTETVTLKVLQWNWTQKDWIDHFESSRMKLCLKLAIVERPKWLSCPTFRLLGHPNAYHSPVRLYLTLTVHTFLVQIRHGATFSIKASTIQIQYETMFWTAHLATIHRPISSRNWWHNYHLSKRPRSRLYVSVATYMHVC